LDDKQKTNEGSKSFLLLLTQRRVVRIRHSKTLKNLLKVSERFNMIMDLIPRKNKTDEAKEASKDQTNMNNNELSKKLEQLETERLTLQEKIAVLEQQHRELEEFLLKMKHEFALAKEALKRDQEKRRDS